MEIENKIDWKKLTELYNRLKTPEEKDRLLTWIAQVDILREYARKNNLVLSIDIAGEI